MTKLAIELLVLTVVLVNFGAILTANIYSKSVKELNAIDYFAVSLSAIPIALFDKNGLIKSGTHWPKYTAFVVTTFAIYFGWSFFNHANFHHFAF